MFAVSNQPGWHLLIQSQQWKHQKKVWNKVKNKDTILTSFCCLYCWLWTDFTLAWCFIADFEQANACWIRTLKSNVNASSYPFFDFTEPEKLQYGLGCPNVSFVTSYDLTSGLPLTRTFKFTKIFPKTYHFPSTSYKRKKSYGRFYGYGSTVSRMHSRYKEAVYF